MEKPEIWGQSDIESILDNSGLESNEQRVERLESYLGAELVQKFKSYVGYSVGVGKKAGAALGSVLFASGFYTVDYTQFEPLDLGGAITLMSLLGVGVGRWCGAEIGREVSNKKISAELQNSNPQKAMEIDAYAKLK